MAVGVFVAGKVTVGVRVGVGVSLGVAVSGTSKVPTGALARTTKKTIVATTAMTTTRMLMAAGRLRVNCGRLVAWTERSVFFTAFGAGWAENSVPHTKQRTAFSLRRVPQVGQTLVLLEWVS